MNRYLFRFGYETPEQMEANDAHGWDDELSFAFYVVAPSREAALSWGVTVVEELVGDMFARSSWKGAPPSWKEGRFAHWIEDVPGPEFTDDVMKSLPVVLHGEMPESLSWL